MSRAAGKVQVLGRRLLPSPHASSLPGAVAGLANWFMFLMTRCPTRLRRSGAWAVREDGRAIKRVRIRKEQALRRPPVRRFLSAPVPLRPILFALSGAVSPRGHWPRAYVLVQHAPPVVAAGEPLDAASPGGGSRQPAAGGADPPPLSNDSGAFPAGRTSGLCRMRKGCEQTDPIFLPWSSKINGLPDRLSTFPQEARFSFLSLGPKNVGQQMRTR